MKSIDLNCDLGEGCGSDAALMPFITSVNVACGGHAGDDETMRRTVELAIGNGVAIGAHPGYEDRENFGRTPFSLTSADVRTMIMRQVERLQQIVDKCGAKMSHVKPHGALYNQAADDLGLAATIAETIAEWDRNLILVGLSGSCSIEGALAAGLRPANEAFGDRRYDSNGRLVTRSVAGAVIRDPADAVGQVLKIVRNESVRSIDGVEIELVADTICLHGDGQNAIAMARALRFSLTEAGVSIVQLDG